MKTGNRFVLGKGVKGWAKLSWSVPLGVTVQSVTACRIICIQCMFVLQAIKFYLPDQLEELLPIHT